MSDDSVFTVSQARRVEALTASRQVLMQTNLFANNPAKNIDDLIKLSTWILGPEQTRADNPEKRATGIDLESLLANATVIEIPIGQPDQSLVDEAKQRVVDLMGEDGVPDEARRAAVKMLRNNSCEKPDCIYCVQARELADSIENQIGTTPDEAENVEGPLLTPDEDGGYGNTINGPKPVFDDEAPTEVIPAQNPFPSPEQVSEAQGNFRADPIPVGNWADDRDRDGN